MDNKVIDKNEIRESGASLLLNIWYIMIQAGYLLLDEAGKRLMEKKYCLKYRQKYIYNKIMQEMERIKKLYDEFDDDFIQSLSDDYRQYDWIREDANEMNRLLLLFADRCSPDEDAKNRLFKFLRSLPEHGHAPEELVETFRMK